MWRVSRDGCLYGITYASGLISSDANTQVTTYLFLDITNHKTSKLSRQCICN